MAKKPDDPEWIDPNALKAAEHRRHEAVMDKVGAKLAKQMQGHVRVIQPENDPVLKVVNEEFQKSARRKIN